MRKYIKKFIGLLIVIILICGFFGYKKYRHIKGVELADQALILIDKKGAFQALDDLDRALTMINPKNKIALARVYKNKGLIYEALDAPRQAAESYRSAQSYFSEDESEYYSFGGMFSLFTRDIDLAVAAFEEALNLDPDNFDAHNHLGLLFMGQLINDFTVNFERALIHNRKAFELEPTMQTRKTLALNLFQLEEFDEALIHFIELDSVLKTDGFIKFFIGIIYFRKNDHFLAHYYLSNAVELAPDIYTEDVALILKETESTVKAIQEAVKYDY